MAKARAMQMANTGVLPTCCPLSLPAKASPMASVSMMVVAMRNLRIAGDIGFLRFVQRFLLGNDIVNGGELQYDDDEVCGLKSHGCCEMTITAVSLILAVSPLCI